MKFRKDIVAIISVMVASTALLSGCDDTNTSKTEDVLMSQCEKQSQQVSCSSAYRKTLEASENFSNYNADDKPFEQQGLIFIMEDRAFKRSHPELKNIAEIWFDLTGKQLYGTPEPSQSGDVKKMDKSYVLSPQMYDELISAVKTCNRATIEAMNFKVGANLSAEQYDKAMNIIIECKQSQLDQAINSKG